MEEAKVSFHSEDSAILFRVLCETYGRLLANEEMISRIYSETTGKDIDDVRKLINERSVEYSKLIVREIAESQK